MSRTIPRINGRSSDWLRLVVSRSDRLKAGKAPCLEAEPLHQESLQLENIIVAQVGREIPLAGLYEREKRLAVQRYQGILLPVWQGPLATFYQRNWI